MRCLPLLGLLPPDLGPLPLCACVALPSSLFLARSLLLSADGLLRVAVAARVEGDPDLELARA
eukprot:11092605-Alexandrium_andersonii.AAC.1